MLWSTRVGFGGQFESAALLDRDRFRSPFERIDEMTVAVVQRHVSVEHVEAGFVAHSFTYDACGS